MGPPVAEADGPSGADGWVPTRFGAVRARPTPPCILPSVALSLPRITPDSGPASARGAPCATEDVAQQADEGAAQAHDATASPRPPAAPRPALSLPGLLKLRKERELAALATPVGLKSARLQHRKGGGQLARELATSPRCANQAAPRDPPSCPSHRPCATHGHSHEHAVVVSDVEASAIGAAGAEPAPKGAAADTAVTLPRRSRQRAKSQPRERVGRHVERLSAPMHDVLKMCGVTDEALAAAGMPAAEGRTISSSDDIKYRIRYSCM